MFMFLTLKQGWEMGSNHAEALMSNIELILGFHFNKVLMVTSFIQTLMS